MQLLIQSSREALNALEEALARVDRLEERWFRGAPASAKA
jgi:hypothetical protein